MNANKRLEGVAEARLSSFDPEAVPYDEFPAYLTEPPAATTSFNYITADTCDPVAGNLVCSNNSERQCLTRYDCVRVEHICPRPAPGMPESSVDDAACFHEYPLAGVFVAFGVGVGAHGTVFFANGGDVKGVAGLTLPGGGYGGRSIGALDPDTGSVRFVPLPSNPNGGLPFPYDLHILKNEDVVVALTGSSAVAWMRRAFSVSVRPTTPWRAGRARERILRGGAWDGEG